MSFMRFDTSILGSSVKVQELNEKEVVADVLASYTKQDSRHYFRVKKKTQ